MTGGRPPGRNVQRRSQQRSDAPLDDRIRRAFTPTSPIRDPTLLAGRGNLLSKAASHLHLPGATLVVYGERGVGKSSFVNVLLADRDRKVVVEHTCSIQDSFESIFRTVLSKLDENITVIETTSTTGGGAELGIAPAKLTGKRDRTRKAVPITAERLDLNLLLDRLKRRADAVDVIVLDEFDRMDDELVRRKVMEVVKGIADRGLATSLVLVGVGESSRDVVRDADVERYARRNVLTVNVPPLSVDEARMLLRQRERFGISFAEAAAKPMLHIACGYPSVIQRVAFDAVTAHVNEYGRPVTAKVKSSWLSRFGFGDRDPEDATISADVEVGKDTVLATLREFYEQEEIAQPLERAVQDRDAALVLQEFAVASGPTALVALATRLAVTEEAMRHMVETHCRDWLVAGDVHVRSRLPEPELRVLLRASLLLDPERWPARPKYGVYDPKLIAGPGPAVTEPAPYIDPEIPAPVPTRRYPGRSPPAP